MSILKSIVFDMDDTLYLERDFVLSGFKAVAAWGSKTYDISSQEGFHFLWESFEQGIRGNTFNLWLEAFDIDDPGAISNMIQVYRNHQPEIAPCEDVLPVLNVLQSRAGLGLITEGYRQVQENKLTALGLESFFEVRVIMGEDEREYWKPNSYPFRCLLDQMGVPAGTAVYVGDNPFKDFGGARRAGMHSVRVRRPAGLHAAIEPESPEFAPDYECIDFHELLIYLERKLEDA